jgi:hypothetical protein
MQNLCRDSLEALGRFALFLQKEDGSFVSKFRIQTGPDPTFESLYYPGEAALGFLSLYDLDHSQVWLNAAGKALSYLARTRADLTTVPADHWALIATSKLLEDCDRGPCPVSREELLGHASQICVSIIRDQSNNGSNPVLHGSFDGNGRTTPTATRMEGLLSALNFLPMSQLRDDVRNAVDGGTVFLLGVQIASGPYIGGMPGAAMSQSSFEVRIDFVQHALCAWLRYQKLFESHESGSQL